eukprot:14458285-Alexandrium_andersonii.AAC.1
MAGLWGKQLASTGGVRRACTCRDPVRKACSRCKICVLFCCSDGGTAWKPQLSGNSCVPAAW